MPLTAEEKKKRKAEKKAQKAKEAEERRIKTRKDELAREVVYSKENVATTMKKWYLHNYEARFPHIKQDMEVAWHMFEHTLDVKDFIISELMNRMDETKTQESMSWQDFSIKVDDLINDFQKRVENLESEYQENQRKLLDKSLRTSSDQRLAQAELEEYYKTVLFIMRQNFIESSAAVQGECITRLDEEGKKGQHAVEVITAALEKNLQTVVADIKETLKNYKESTETRRKEVEVLRLKDEYFMEMIKKQDSKMAKLFEELTNLQGQVNARDESRMVLDDLIKDREETFLEHKDVRAQLTTDAALDDKQLATLTFESNKVITNLERILEKGEKIVRMAALCRKLQTEEEKVLPFGMPIDLEDDHQMEDEEMLGSFSLFWRRYANANFTKKKLESELEELYKENEDLQKALEDSLEIMAMTRA